MSIFGERDQTIYSRITEGSLPDMSTVEKVFNMAPFCIIIEWSPLTKRQKYQNTDIWQWSIILSNTTGDQKCPKGFIGFGICLNVTLNSQAIITKGLLKDAQSQMSELKL